MNRKKLQEKLVKIIGGLETDKSFLFDTFISKLFDTLSLGQKIKINDLGYFHKIKFEIFSKNKNNLNNNDGDLSSIIVFSESENLEELLSEDQIFFEPTKFELENSYSENLLSISIGKEFLNTTLSQTDNILIPTSQNEYFDLLDSKIERLISASDILENKLSDIPCLNINIEKDEKDFSIKISEDISTDKKVEIILQTTDLIDNESNEIKGYDFTELLSNELSESTFSNQETNGIISEKIGVNEISLTDQSEDFEFNLDVTNQTQEDSIFNDLLKLEEIEEQIEDSNISVEEKNIIVESDLDVSKDHPTTEIIDDEELEISGEISWDKIISEISTDDEEISIENIFNVKNVVEAKSEDLTENLIDEINSLDKETSLDENIESAFIETNEEKSEDVFEDLIKEIEADEEKEQLNLIDELKVDVPDEVNEVDEVIEDSNDIIESFEEITEEEIVEEELLDEEDFPKETDDEIFDEKELEDVEDDILTQSPQQELSTSKIIEEDVPKRSNKIWIMLILLVIIVSSAVVYYLFPEYFIIFKAEGQKINSMISDKNVTKIERNFDIPVTYPYPPIEEKMSNESLENNIQIETNLPEKSSENQKIENDIKEKTTTSTTQEKVQTQNANFEKVSETISKLGDIYVVQVASIKSETIAQKEVDRIKSKGFSAYVEKADIPNRGIWYRIKVSGFKSSSEAQSFQLKYSKGEI